MEKELFKDFIEATSEIFRDLEAEYGFEQLGVSIHPPECNVEYKNSTTLLSITHELGGLVWILVWKTDEAGKIKSPYYDLGKLVKRVYPERAEGVDPPYVFGERNKKNLKENLAAYLDFLCREGRGILRGDFSMFMLKDTAGL